MTDGVSHGEYGEAESEGNAYVADSEIIGSASKNCCTAASENKPECADSFGDSASRKFHIHLHEKEKTSKPM